MVNLLTFIKSRVWGYHFPGPFNWNINWSDLLNLSLQLPWVSKTPCTSQDPVAWPLLMALLLHLILPRSPFPLICQRPAHTHIHTHFLWDSGIFSWFYFARCLCASGSDRSWVSTSNNEFCPLDIACGCICSIDVAKSGTGHEFIMELTHKFTPPSKLGYIYRTDRPKKGCGVAV